MPQSSYKVYIQSTLTTANRSEDNRTQKIYEEFTKKSVYLHQALHYQNI